MTHSELTQELLKHGFTRIERDDRLLDIFPAEDREKGVELWERWADDTVHVVKIKLPFTEKGVWIFSINREELEGLLAGNTIRHLSDYPIVA